jgi:hypothetical protein
MEWLVASLMLSVVLTVVLNVALRLFPNGIDRAVRRLDRPHEDRAVRVFAPWKAMIIASVVLTIVLNLVLWLA